MDTPPQDSGAPVPTSELIRERRVYARSAIVGPRQRRTSAARDLLDLDQLASETSRFLGVTLSNQYELLELIGEGGMGMVFRARQIAVDRDVAVKVLHRHLAKDERAVQRFENEARAISRLRHPNTLRLYDCQRTEDGDFFLVTELLTGRPLSRLLFDEHTVPLDRALRIVDHVCRSLAEAHAEGIVHRDLKPENVFLDRVGSEEMVKVLDFGIAKILQDNTSLTRSGMVSGTPLYMSPEQAQGFSLDTRTDIYSLGVMLYEMITGAPPYMAESGLAICALHVTAPMPALCAPALGELEPRVESLVHRMIAKRPEDRPASVEELREELARLMQVTTPVSSPRVEALDQRPTLPAEPPRLLAEPVLSREGGAIPSDSFALAAIEGEIERFEAHETRTTRLRLVFGAGAVALVCAALLLRIWIGSTQAVEEPAKIVAAPTIVVPVPDPEPVPVTPSALGIEPQQTAVLPAAELEPPQQTKKKKARLVKKRARPVRARPARAGAPEPMPVDLDDGK